MTSPVDMPNPLPLIVDDNHGKISVVKETYDIIGNIDKPVMVVAVAGIYRTGKSYLMNRLMGRDGFELGSTVQSKTKGIWIWARDHPQVKDCVLILIDTEGLADPQKADTRHDVWIFVLAILLSNIFIFNSKGTIDSKSLGDLHLVTELADHLIVKSAQDDRDAENFRTMSPLFIWAVRDFFLDCKIDGKILTANEYLEWGLARKHGHSKAIRNANNISDSIKTFFPKRHCYLFPVPVADFEKLKFMEEVKPGDFNQKFLDVSTEFEQFVLSHKEPKLLAGTPVSGKMFVQMAASYVEAIRNNVIPCIQNTVDSIARTQNEKAREDAGQIYDSHWEKISLPIKASDVQAIHSRAQEDAVNKFLSKSMLDKDMKAAEAFGLYLDNKLQQQIQANNNASRQKSTEAFRKLYKPIDADVKRGVFMAKGGYKMYADQMARLQEQYLSLTGLGDEKNKILDESLTKLESQRESILRADQELNKQAKKTEMERLKREEQERQLLVKQEEVAKMKYQHEEAIKNFNAASDQLKKEMTAQAEKEKEELRQLMEKDKEESIKLMQAGFKEEADLMRQNVDDLMKQMNNMVRSFRRGYHMYTDSEL